MAKAAAKFDPLLDEIPPPAQASALSALFLGTAEADQQKLAVEWILLHACRLNGATFNPDPITSAFLQGRQQAGRIILNAARTSPKGAKAVEDLNNKESET